MVANPAALSSRPGQVPYPMAATNAQTTMYDGPTSIRYRLDSGWLPCTIWYARIPSLTPVPTTCAATTRITAPSLPSTRAAAASPTSPSTSQTVASDSPRNADVTMAAIG